MTKEKTSSKNFLLPQNLDELTAGLRGPRLTQSQFVRLSRLVHDLSGIKLRDGKQELVKARLTKRLKALNISDFEGYLQFLEADKSRRELANMIDLISTNKTHFFRERDHFDYFQKCLLPQFKTTSLPLRIWSAGCSFGQEAYSLAILIRESMLDLARRDIKILATDISRPVLAKARQGIYEESDVAEVPPPLRRRHFRRLDSASPRRYQIVDAVRDMVRFARLNLISAWPMKGPFQAIFCRNVMIYFDKPTQEELVQRFWQLLAPGGHFFVGHSESLTGLSHAFHYVQPAVYRRSS